MIFNTIIKGKGGESGVPIEVAELPEATADTVGKVYLNTTDGNYYVGKQSTDFVVGKPVGDKIYFDTTKNPVDYSLGTLLEVGNDNAIIVGFYDVFELQGITGMGHCYAIGVANEDMSIFLGMPYVYCDVLTVDQFNTNVGASLGLPAITEFGWQTDVIDTSAVADYEVTINNLADWDFLAYGNNWYEFEESNKSLIESEKEVAEIIWNRQYDSEQQLLNVLSRFETIYSYIFAGSTINVENINIPTNITVISTGAFYNATGFKKIYIPNSVKYLWDGVFETELGMPELTTIEIEDNSVTSIPYYFVRGQSSLETIILPNSLTQIEYKAFYGCSSLTSITIPDRVTSIGGSAFANCSSLTSVYITDINAWCNISFEDISSNPLYSAKAKLYLNNELVTKVIVPDGVTSINYNFSGCSSLTSITIPDSVTSISRSAFSQCSSLTNVIIGKGITSIGGLAFYDCSSLQTITIKATTPPTIAEDTIYNCPALVAIYVPAESVYAYKAASGWSARASLIQADPDTIPTVTVNYTVDGNDHAIMGDTAPETVAYGSEFNFQVDCEQGYEVDANNITVTGATLASTRTVYEEDGVTEIPESLLLYFTDVTGDVTINIPLQQY